MTPSRKQAQSEGRDGLPAAWQWLSDLGVKPGEFQVETKARLRHAMKSREWPEKQRVWACLSLATMGFNQELAVKLERGQAVPLTQGDIEKQTGILVKNVHRCVLELESEGWLLRVPVDEARGLRRGEVQIHCYAIPRPPKKPKVKPEAQTEADKYAGLEPELSYWLRHLKLGVPPAEKLEKALVLAAGLSASVDAFRELCRPEPDQMPLPGVPVNPVKVSKRVSKLTELKPRAVETPLARGSQKSVEGLRAGRFDSRARALPNKEEIKEIKTTTAAAVKKVGQSPPPQGSWELAELKIELSKLVQIDDAAVRRLWDSCKAGTFNCTEEEVAAFCMSKSAGLKTARNPVGVLLTSIPTFFSNGGSEALMQRRRKMQEVDAIRQADAIRCAHMVLESDDREWTEEDKNWARGVLAVKPRVS